MTVEQLIEKLKEFPPYRTVLVGEKPAIEVKEVDVTRTAEYRFVAIR